MILIKLFENKLGLFRSKEINERIFDKVKASKDKNIESNDNSNAALDNRLLDKENARLRHDIAKLWLLDIPLQEKAKRILQLVKEEGVGKALTGDQKDMLSAEHDKHLDDYLRGNKNKYMEIHREEYDGVPATLKYYTNTGLCNFNRHMDLVLREMTNDRQIRLFDIENKVEVRNDICNNLGVPIHRRGSVRDDVVDESDIDVEFERDIDMSNVRLSIPINFNNGNATQIRRYTKK
jgi:hypothetical protein